MKQAILLFGGSSAERLVSIASAQNVWPAFAPDTSRAWFIAPNGSVHETSGVELLAHQRPFTDPFRPVPSAFAHSMAEACSQINGAAVFIALHGTEGEDGSLQDLFDLHKIAFTGSGAKSSRLCFDKIQAKAIVQRTGLRTAEQTTFATRNVDEALAAMRPLFDACGKIVMKPIANGSSFGLRIISDDASLREAAAHAAGSDDPRFMAETFIEGREITVGIVDRNGKPEALPVSEVLVEVGRSFDYEGKYLGHGSVETTPADLPEADALMCKEAALLAHLALECEGYSRTDLIWTKRGAIFLETNTLPGLSKASFVPQQLRAAGIELRIFIDRQLELARLRAQDAR